jgi:hypothetical protein
MTDRPLQAAVRLSPGAFLALLGALAFAPSSARAGCNNHVRVAGQYRVLGLDSFADLVVGPSDAGRPAPGPRDVPPCSGPSCSEGSRVPLIPPSASSTRHHRLWCDTAAPPPEPAFHESAARMEAAPLYRLRRRTDVDRPPRTYAA